MCSVSLRNAKTLTPGHCPPPPDLGFTPLLDNPLPHRFGVVLPVGGPQTGKGTHGRVLGLNLLLALARELELHHAVDVDEPVHIRLCLIIPNRRVSKCSFDIVTSS